MEPLAKKGKIGENVSTVQFKVYYTSQHEIEGKQFYKKKLKNMMTN